LVSHARHWHTESLEGQRFSRLIVESYAGRYHAGGSMWNCRCDCGATTVARACSLKKGATKSCGCLNQEWRRQRCTKHGGWKRPEYGAWQHMRMRCVNPNEPYYERYGGRGIRVCDRWADDFGAFIADMGPRPTPQHSIERINNDGHYEPKNCRWATPREQSLNTSRNRWLEHDGIRLTVPDWAKRIGVNEKTIRNRLRDGWPIATVLSAQRAPRLKRKTA
jgi:hypothetical protein